MKLADNFDIDNSCWESESPKVSFSGLADSPVGKFVISSEAGSQAFKPYKEYSPLFRYLSFGCIFNFFFLGEVLVRHEIWTS